MGGSPRLGRYLLAGAGAVALVAIGARALGGKDEAAPPTPGASSPAAPDVGEMVAGLEARLKAEPNDAAGWRMLGWSYFNMQRFDRAAEAYRRATALSPDDAALWSALGETLVLGGKGVGDDAAQAFRRALAVDPKDPRARYFLAVKQDMDGDHAGAVDAWIALLRDTPAGAPWEQSVRELVQTVAAREKIDIAGRLPAASAPPAAPSTGGADAATAGIPGPSQEQLAAAAALPPGQQNEMARGMVDRLAARLAQNPRDVDGWLRLMRARVVLEDRAGATQALATARRTFADDAAARARLDEGARALSL
ncbi:tetratricopeptide repeat protein [Sphingomonas adhaesiva]|uniref:tetratricopeptide repeat protein n=1 Tax=Sphingomonas adhaesiva TaxID=28212 RepID=UPI002FF65E03